MPRRGDGFGSFFLPARNGVDPRAALRGMRAQQGGDRAEDWWKAHHDEARRRGLARIRKVSPEVKFARARGGAVAPHVVGENGCDYVGVIRPGRGFVAEAKSSDDARLGRSAFERATDRRS
jgi:hypothetical protein